MRPVYFYPQLLGAEHGLVVDDVGYRWSSRRPPECWAARGETRQDEEANSLDELARLEAYHLPATPPDPFVKSVASLSGGKRAMWSHALPRRVYKGFLDRLVAESTAFLEGADTSYYLGSWTPHRRVFSSLARMAAPDPALFSPDAEVDASSFRPRGGYCDRITYDRFGTRTGRLTVASGPTVLTLRKDLRKFLRSRHGGSGVLLQVDFSALEVRLLAADPTRSVPLGDPYQDLADELGMERPAAKLALISTTYGASDRGLAAALGVDVQRARAVVEAIHRRHGVDALLSRLRAEHSRLGYVRNAYGRRVEVPDAADGMLLNSYLQSTGVDVALWGFLQVIDRLPEGHGAPVALIHDAMVLDVTQELAGRIGGSLSVPVPGYEGKFPLKVEQLNT